MNKIAILGCGNMGGAIARGLAAQKEYNIIVTSKSGSKAQAIAEAHDSVQATSDNRQAVRQADVVIVAVKPWLVQEVLDDVEELLPGKTVISVAAGVTDERIMVYAMPNIAVEFQQGMTFIQRTENTEAVNVAKEIFSRIGSTKVVEPSQMQAGMMLSGCGIAYVMRMVRAMMQGGTEMGFRPGDACDIATQTLQGAAAVLQNTKMHPEAAIDCVTTPGGYTIKGLNELDHAGFTSAVIRALKAGLK